MSEKPTSVQGGCLCGSVRYTVNFPPDHDFSTGSTCQCVQCRKQTGGLYLIGQSVPFSSVSFTKEPNKYYATPGIARGFCAACGSFLFWRDENSDSIVIAVGGFDKEVMKKYGKTLADVRRHIWCRDAIEGVTDLMRGKKWELDNEGEDAVLLGDSGDSLGGW